MRFNFSHFSLISLTLFLTLYLQLSVCRSCLCACATTFPISFACSCTIPKRMEHGDEEISVGVYGVTFIRVLLLSIVGFVMWFCRLIHSIAQSTSQPSCNRRMPNSSYCAFTIYVYTTYPVRTSDLHRSLSILLCPPQIIYINIYNISHRCRN